MEYAQKSARLPKTPEEKESWKRVIIILEHCPLSSVMGAKGHELLSEKHKNTHRKNNQDPAAWRPDVVHQCLLHLMDSPLSRSGQLQVFLRTKKGVCIAVDPRLRVPRSMRIFEKMMVSLLYRMKVRSTTGYLNLLKVVKNPITDHMPAHVRLIRVEKDGELVDPFLLPQTLGKSSKDEVSKQVGSTTSSSGAFEALHTSVAQGTFRPFAFVIGGMSKGDVDADWCPKHQVQSIRLGDRGMSAAAVCSALVHGFEESWLADDNKLSTA
jgi:rRNA small subunit pseudouridine methyltransferase Nep1